MAWHFLSFVHNTDIWQYWELENANTFIKELYKIVMVNHFPGKNPALSKLDENLIILGCIYYFKECYMQTRFSNKKQLFMLYELWVENCQKLRKTRSLYINISKLYSNTILKDSYMMKYIIIMYYAYNKCLLTVKFEIFPDNLQRFFT